MSMDRWTGPAGGTHGAPLRLGFQVWGQFVTWPDLMACGQRIDELGFSSLWSNDHLLPVAGGGPEALEMEEGPVWDGWMTLAGWAERTSRVTLGCLVSSVSYRHPALLVKMAAALDHASGGRAVLGLGAGWHAAEHQAFGFEHLPVRERLDRFEEGVRIARAMLDGEAAHVDGRWLRSSGAHNEPAPLQARLPLLIGGSGEKRTMPLVARYADAWNGEGDPETYGRKNALLDGLCREAGRDPTSIRRTVGLPPPLIRARREDAIAALAALLERHGLPARAAREAARTSPLAGTADQVAEHVRRYRDAGAEEAMFDWPTPSDDETLEALAGPVRERLAA
jgi:alkanesulfonate monooxygenase SsuD/methylene tetrahydromethanopterin reductase-like flavin-dependent oxidoreductase (luciferase family)